MHRHIERSTEFRNARGRQIARASVCVPVQDADRPERVVNFADERVHCFGVAQVHGEALGSDPRFSKRRSRGRHTRGSATYERD